MDNEEKTNKQTTTTAKNKQKTNKQTEQQQKTNKQTHNFKMSYFYIQSSYYTFKNYSQFHMTQIVSFT